MSDDYQIDVFEPFLATMKDVANQQKLRDVLAWVLREFPTLEPAIKWNQPMFTHHGTFIIAFSVSKSHFAVGTEGAEIEMFKDAIAAAGYKASKMLFRIKWTDEVDFPLLRRIIAFNMDDKAECKTFWRK